MTKRMNSTGFDRVAALDVLLVVTVLVAVKQTLLPYSQLYAGPISTLTAICVATALFHHQGSAWRDLGFVWPQSWFSAGGLTLQTMSVFIAATQLMGLIADAYFVCVNDGSRFDHVEGNLIAYLTIMLLVWTHGSFFEELLFRAFLITKLGETFGRTRAAMVVALITSSAFFGYRHAYYQGCMVRSSRVPAALPLV
ncbi:type II CAAX prenyl endopeptidase Rce1 family protein [Amaricoccus tamworthensis]|uniref:CPBP family glutamic-type intramembrane protease n=1 Tax=Amaricoccus tamworthensis TaxID=57002 RepID=UPI003C79BF8C